MHGGVGGEKPRGFPLSRLCEADTTNPLIDEFTTPVKFYGCAATR